MAEREIYTKSGLNDEEVVTKQLSELRLRKGKDKRDRQ
jgi:hypothetical protein